MPKIVAGSDRDGFRLVRVGEGNSLRYVLEVPDGCDALGVERWREFKTDSQHLRNLLGFLIKTAVQQEQES